MSESSWDAVIVGARVAGAPTAMLLARAGYRVLLVDRATFPSDTISTHLLHPTGVAALRRWGLLERLVATGCPPIERYVIDFDVAVLTGTPPPTADGGRTAYGPRRVVLDALLVDAAREAGVTVREAWSVDEVVVSDGRVVGVRGHHKGEAPTFESARVVVGADGKHSSVLKAVGVMDYDGKPAYTAGYYAYWRGLPIHDFRVHVRPHRSIVVVPTHDDLTLVLVGWPRREFSQHKATVESTYLDTIASVPSMASLMAGATRETRFVGTGDMPNAFRKPWGEGWALVGDAGYVKDPSTAQGISDAFRDAELLATALDDAWSGRASWAAALGGYQKTRDRTVKPLYDFTALLAPMDPLPPFVQFLFRSMEGNQRAMDRFMGVFAGTVPVRRFFNPFNVIGILAARMGRAVSPASLEAKSVPSSLRG